MDISATNNDKDLDLRVTVLLSAQRALLGAITPNVRGVTVAYNNQQLTLRAYYDKDPLEEEKELLDFALGEMVADFYPSIEKYLFEPQVLPYPMKMAMLSDWVYVRHEVY